LTAAFALPHTRRHEAVRLGTVRLETLAMCLAGGVPFALYVATASGHAYWLDSGEFVAASLGLGIAHPPGHPLTALWGAAIALLPLGSLSFRVAIGQALATGLASALQCRASVAVCSGVGLPTRLLWPIGVFAAWLTAFTYGVWFQAVRPEVYALQTLCVAIVFERLATQLGKASDGDARPLLAAALALGLGLANHHLIAFLVAPAFVPVVWRLVRARRFSTLGWASGLGALGLGTYVYLPLRAATHPPLNLGNPTNLERFYWVTSAQVYAQNLDKQAQQPLLDRVLDVVVLFTESFSALPLLLALIGLYLLARHPGTRRHALLCALLLFVDAGVRAALGPVRANPDILGYLAPSLLALGTLAAGCIAVLAWFIHEHAQQHRRRLAIVLTLLPLAALALIPNSRARASLRDFAATDAVDEVRLRRLPGRSVVVTSMPQTAFRAWELAATEVARPDVITVALPFLRYPGVSDALLARYPELAPVVHGFLAHHDHLQADSLVALAATRPVFVELDTRIPTALYASLRPRGWLTQVRATAEPVARGQLSHALSRAHAELSALLKSERSETETAHQLLWAHYMNALHLAAIFERELARMELDRALALYPHDRRVVAFAQALREDAAIDIGYYQQL
jgi:hypothetical protein